MKSFLTTLRFWGFRIFCVLIVLSLMFSYFLNVYYLSKIDHLESRLQSYEYLDKYHCWTATFKTTYYTTHATECSKRKDHRFFGITYSGRRAIKGRTVAVDPTVVPLGSKLIDVETGEIYDADDTGNEVRGQHVDIFIGEGTDENRKKAASRGCRRRMFIVIEPGRI